MADVITNMKVRFGADTKQFKKGLDEGKQSSKQFGKDAGSAFDSFAAAFGINMGKVREGLSKVNTSLTATTTGFKSAAAGSNIFTKALGILKTAIIATGIGALIVALGSLISYFTKTQRGADFLHKVMKAIGTTTSVLVDRLSALGETIFNAFSNPKEAIFDLWEAIKTNIVNRFTGLIDLFEAVGNGLEALWKRDMTGLKTAAYEAGTAIVQMTSGLDEAQQKKLADGIRGITTEIKEEAKASFQLEAARQRLRDREISLIEIQAKRRKELEAARLLAKDETVSAKERLDALTRAQGLEQQTLKENTELQKQRISVMQQEVDLGESMAEDYRMLAEEKAKLHQIESESIRLQRRLKTEMNSLTKEIETQTQEVIKNRQQLTAWAKPIESKGLVIPELKMPQLETEKLMDNLKTGLDTGKNAIIDFADTFNQSFADLAGNFGEFMGGLISGTSGFQDFGNILLGSLGDLAIRVGKMAIATGLAVSGIKKALQSMNPAIAIAAGAALVAVGTAIKGALSSVVNGNSSTSGSIGSNSYLYDTRGASSVFGQTIPAAQTQSVNVHVTGQFRQEGTALVATINETQKRSNYR